MAQDKTKEISQMSYEEALAELEQLSNKMSQGGLTLEESVATYQRKIQKLDSELTAITSSDLKDDVPF